MLSEDTIKKYRKLARKIGLWDITYQSIKEDLPYLKRKMEEQDACLDTTGAMIEQFKLVIRAVVYGNSDGDYTSEDLETLFKPFGFFEDFELTSNVLAAGADSAVENALPLLFEFMEMSDDLDEFEQLARTLTAKVSGISNFALGYSIAMSMCFKKYPDMKKYLKIFCSFMESALADSEKTGELMESVKKHHPTPDVDFYMFSALMAAMIVERNLDQNISVEKMRELVNYINSVAPVEMRKFIHDGDFRTFIGTIMEYYELSD